MSTNVQNHTIVVPIVLQLPTIFYPSADDYLYPLEAGMSDPQGQDCYLPIEVDTEFYHPPIDLTKASPANLSPTITVQCRAIALETGTIFTHMDSAAYARHPLAESDFIVVDYLRSLGHQVTLERSTTHDPDLPLLQVDLYAFFAVAELMRIVQNDYQQDIRELCLVNRHETYGIAQGRRLRTFTRYQDQYASHVDTKWILTLNGFRYGVRLCWYDTCAVHGATSYAGFCQNTGTPIPYKDNFTSAEKGDMLRMYCDRSEDFDNYALGDLYNHRALVNNVALLRTVYKTLGLEQFFQKPRLTTGATVRDLLESCVGKMFQGIHLNKSPREIVNAYCKWGTAEEIKKRITTTAAWNAKVDGGRCRNNRPTDTTAKGVLADLDISGCYGEGLRVQLFPVGVPVIIDYPLDSERNTYLTLGRFLKTYGKELVTGLWQARVSTLEGYQLKNPQDFLMSWFPPKDISKMPTDSEKAETDEWWDVDNVGLLKIFTHQVNLALINHDFIQWLDNVASARQRKELLENLYVHTAMFYPASERVDSPAMLRHRHDTHKGRNTCTIKKVRGRTTKISIEQECHAWYGETLGDMLVTQLIRARREHPKKSPLNELYKLYTNTTYGDMVSHYFAVGNVVVGNNITARARALAWYMEKGLHGYQTITDGCAFDLNCVLNNGSIRVNGQSVVGLYRQGSKNTHLEFKALGDYDSIGLQVYETSDGLQPGLNLSNKCKTISDTYSDSYDDCSTVSDSCLTVLDTKESLSWISRVAWEHLQSLFPDVDVLHTPTTDVDGNARMGQFSFECKGLYDAASFHGTANYCFQRFGEIQIVKMRSYSKRPQEQLSANNLTVSNDDYYPAKSFLTGLLSNPSEPVRQPVYLKSNILKVGDYSKHYTHKYDSSKVFPGMTVKQASLLREFSLSQFTYQNLEQFRAWERESERLRKHYGQSYEQYFINANGSLDYQLMVIIIDRLITQGKKGFWDGDNKRSKHGYRVQTSHPAQENLKTAREVLQRHYDYKNVPGSSSDEDETEGVDD